MRVEFDPKKALVNVKKHGVTLDEGAGSLFDPMALPREDEVAEGEERFVLMGMSREGRLLTVCYSLPDEETIRLISVRKSTRREEKQYAKRV